MGCKASRRKEFVFYRENATFPFPVFFPLRLTEKTQNIKSTPNYVIKTNLMHYLSSVYFVIFRAYLYSIIRRSIVYIQHVPIVVYIQYTA